MKARVLRSLAPLGAALTFAACGGGTPEATTPAPEPAPEEAAAPEEPAPETPPEPEPPPEPDPAAVKAELLAAEQAAYQLAEPVFAKHCARCHTKGNKKVTKAKKKALAHFEMTSYPFGGDHAHEMGGEIREVLGIGGGNKPTMPMDKPGAVQGDELKLIADWADAYDKAKAGGAHEGAESGAPAEPQ
jgi:hypothetical protein